jgi:hypothetical protein
VDVPLTTDLDTQHPQDLAEIERLCLVLADAEQDWPTFINFLADIRKYRGNDDELVRWLADLVVGLGYHDAGLFSEC